MSKRYETMTGKQIVEFVEQCQDRICKKCPAYGGFNDSTSFFKCCATYLKTEVSMKKRWQTIKSDEDLMQMRKEFLDFCRSKTCRECEFGETKISEDCFCLYLCQEVEVPNE